MTKPLRTIALAFVSCLAACGGDDGGEPGTLTVAIYGEELIEEGIPADVFVDGWSVEFDRFLVRVGEVSAAAGQDDSAIDEPGYRVFDLARPSGGAGFEVISAEVPGGAYDHISYRIAGGAEASAGNASADDVTLMTDGGLAVYAEGTARKGEVEKRFAWPFSSPTRYSHCAGTAVIDGDAARTVLTIHADHLFYDDLVSSEPGVAFDLIAAADDEGDGDGEITPDELAAVDITGEDRYQVGNQTEVEDLWAFIDAQTATLGHIDGEGHCDEAVRE